MKILCSLSLIGLFISYNISAEESYSVPKGEQPSYGKKYSPDSYYDTQESQQKAMFFELTTHVIFTSQVQFNTEFAISRIMTLGADFDYKFSGKNIYNNNEITTIYYGIAPKVRWYPIETFESFFIGGKLNIGNLQWESKIENTQTKKYYSGSDLFMAPTVHIGYRLISNGGFTFTFYMGGGPYVIRPKLNELNDTKNIPTRDAFLKDFNFRYDGSITIGIAL